MLFLLSVGQLRSQPLTGTVTDKENQPLAGVHVVIDSLAVVGTVTDAAGKYSLANLPRGTHTITFRSVGFAASVHKIEALGKRIEVNAVLFDDVVELDEIVTEAEGQNRDLIRATLSVTALDPAEIEAIRGQTLAKTLSHLAGLSELTTGPGISKPVIRGLHSHRLIILNAGVPQEGQQWGGDHAPAIDPFAPVTINVIRGAAGVEFGPRAIGGMIRLEPIPPPLEPGLAGHASLHLFSNNRQAASSIMMENGVRAVRGLGWRAQASMRKAGSSQTPDYFIGNSGYEELNGSLTAGYEANRFSLRSHASVFTTELGLYSGAHIGNTSDLLREIARGAPAVEYPFTYRIATPKQTVRHAFLTLIANINLRTGSGLKMQFGTQRNKRREYDAHRRFGEPGLKPAFDLGLATHTMDVRYRSAPTESFFWALGANGMNQQNINARGAFLIPNFRAVTGGVYAQATWGREPWIVEAGLRTDHRWLITYPRISRLAGFEQKTHAWTGGSGVIGVIRRLGRDWSLATNLGTAWRPPGVNELYNFGVHHGTAQFEVGSADLGGERSRSLDLTLRHEGESTQLEVSAYSNQIFGYIHLFPEKNPRVTIRGAFPSFRYIATNAHLNGFDGQMSFEPLHWLRLRATGSVVRGKDRVANTPLIYMPADRMTVGLEFRIPESLLPGKSDFEIEGMMVDRQSRYPAGVDYADPPQGYTLLNIGYHLEFASGICTSVSVRVQNLFDVAYRDYLSRFRYYIDDPSRNIVFKLSIPLAGQKHRPHK